ncbi:MAG: YdcF family protein [Alphaproteobacteria bacterium]|nr:YdcF family protein [Alphaproteobacteria bacterium]
MRRGNFTFRIVSIALIALIATWLAGLPYFAAGIPRQAAPAVEKADAIVVLTGGTLRLERGLELLGQHVAKKLFVSGVHRGVDVQQLLRLSRQSPQALDCCIALGYSADHTAGNAEETADWLRKQGYQSIYLVTASYHMPRSLVEFRARMPAIRTLPFPVFPEQVKLEEWWRWPGTASLIVGEYNKYLLAILRREFDELLGG